MGRSAGDWHWEDVKAAVRKRGTTLTALSRQLGFSRNAISVLNFTSIPRVQASLAGFLHLPPQAIWPSRYDPDGQPLRKRRSDAGHPKPRLRRAAPQKQESA